MDSGRSDECVFGSAMTRGSPPPCFLSPSTRFRVEDLLGSFTSRAVSGSKLVAGGHFSKYYSNFLDKWENWRKTAENAEIHGKREINGFYNSITMFVRSYQTFFGWADIAEHPNFVLSAPDRYQYYLVTNCNRSVVIVY